MRSSKLNIVDLAGSERTKDTQAEGKRLQEACKINQSLSFLGRVINFLAEAESKKAHGGYINFRESKLTHLLKDSLGGNSKTVIICTLNPNQMAMRETITTLKFAERAKKIKNKAVVNEEHGERYFQSKYHEALKELAALKGEVGGALAVPRQIGVSQPAQGLQVQGFEVINTSVSNLQRELGSVTGNIKDLANENEELRTTFDKAVREMDSFKKSSNFRLSLYQSKENKQLDQFFSKYLSAGNADPLTA